MALSGEEHRVKALYNLARTSQYNDGIRQWTDALLALDPNHKAGTILHSRTMGDAQAKDFLSRAGSAAAGSLGSGSAASGSSAAHADSADGALLSLESVRRASPNQEALRTVAQIWLLIEKYPQDGRLYRWGAYYFQTMAFFEELQQLLSMAALHGLSGDQAFWIDLHRGLEAMRLGQLNLAEQRLAASYEGWADWRVPANLGRIKESQLSVAKALELYGTAISLGRTDRRPTGLPLAQEGTRASAEELSILHQRMARCYAALGRAADARRALESALEINPDNREARMELRKM
jgi:tetratricopeptide (TPR) repeat protein